MARSSRRRGGGLLRVLNFLPFLPVAGKAPLYARLLWSLVNDPRVPTSRKALLGLAGAYIVAPVDLIPDWVPILGAADDVAVMVLAIDVFLEGLPEGLVAEKLVALGIPPSELEDDLAQVRRIVPRPLRSLAARMPALLDQLAERISESGMDKKMRAAIEAHMPSNEPSSEGNAA
jgi:uncharacterized membrane protein YkvA (DUF1232 family)